MAKIKIYMKLAENNGTKQLIFRDNEGHEGTSIISEALPGDRVLWLLDNNSGIKEITDVKIEGSESIFSKGPFKVNYKKWKGRISDVAVGESGYLVSIIDENVSQSESKKTAGLKSGDSTEFEPPKIKIKE